VSYQVNHPFAQGSPCDVPVCEGALRLLDLDIVGLQPISLRFWVKWLSYWTILGVSCQKPLSQKARLA